MRSSVGWFAIALIVMAALCPQGLTAQAPTPADSAAVLLEAARDFEARGRGEVAEAIYQLIAERYEGTAAGAVALGRLSEFRRVVDERSGRVELQVWSSLYGLWLGVAVPSAFGADDAEAYGAGILLGVPAGFLAARAMTRSRHITEGQARAITWGGTWGTWQGLGWSEVFDFGSEVVCSSDFCYESDGSTEAQFTSMIVGGLVGVTTGAILSRRDISTGVAAGAHYGSLWGTWLGVAGGVIGDLEDDDLMASTLLVGNAGLAAGAYLASRHELSRDRLRLISLGGLLGGLAGAGLDLLFQPDDEKVALGIPLALSGAGLVAATHITRDYDGGNGARTGARGAFLGFDHQGWDVDLPVPLPTLVRAEDRNGRDRWTPALRFTLLSGKF